MEYVTKEDWLVAASTNAYLAGRWSYYGPAVESLKRLRPVSVLEIGGAPFPVCRDAVRMEYPRIPGAVEHDARRLPWPFSAGAFDVVVALQVFEHLDAGPDGKRVPALAGTQQRAFREIKRIASAAILSVPIGWRMEDPTDCHHMISEETVAGWFGERPHELIRCGAGRSLYVFQW